ncbi:DUF3037 domain-containing protein [Planococcus glaciei]|uniref:DUF3037 domain-containing protein n=1 Tax=Planococcus glaciei TaxID=459472 RepID=UPI001C73CBB1|nr:DUF3037 domain-containing protein [Planococcus glaciei]MBX0315493.1 DUF3037 domain-containing protein [Planococcus glaciei]
MSEMIYFSICRYVPSVLRGEKVNIGFAYHIPSLNKIGFKRTKNIKRIKSFDDELEMDMIHAIFESLDYDFGEGSLIDYEEFENINLSDENLLNDRIKSYVNQIQFSQVKVFSAEAGIEQSLKDIADLFLYYDKKKNERINQDKVRALATKMVNNSMYKNSITKFNKRNDFYEVPYDFSFNINGQEKFVKAFSFDYTQVNRFYKEIKAYLYDLDHAVKNNDINLNSIQIVINDTNLEKDFEKTISKELPEEIDMKTLDEFSSILNAYNDELILQ